MRTQLESRACLKTLKDAVLPNFRSKPESFLQACRGTSRETDAAEGEKAVKDALQRVLRHVLKTWLFRELLRQHEELNTV